MKKMYFVLVGAAALMACSQPEKSGEAVEDTAMADTTIVEESTETNIFGESINVDAAISVEELATMMATADSVPATVKATATDVCAKKGCWMKVAMNDSTEMRITFKDYGFFVPKDIAGKQIVFEGFAKKEITSVEDLKHFAEDGGQSPEEIAKITEPEEAITFEATGVVIM
ncbi:DUF4920 domain-containing protein [Acidiluteibacter ferrifornacis]|nr:DUF4920 domain-containing protein [Acidiluteibacter ferrifornacis]